MRQVESLFLINIIRPGQRLKQAVQQRKFLQNEYLHMLNTIRRAGYNSLEELQEKIHRVLEHDRLSWKTLEDEEIDDTWENVPGDYKDIQAEDLLEAFSKEELNREFKRVVLPRVHPDTSDTTPEIFQTVYEVYKRGDYLLMEAYILEYRPEIQPAQEKDVLDSLDQMLKQRDYTQHLLIRLQKKIEKLIRDLTKQEKQDLNKIEDDMKERRQEILFRIQEEAEQILIWREKINNLVDDFKNIYGSSGENK